MPTLTSTQWRTFTIVVAAVTAFLLAQPDGTLPLWAKLIVGAINVAMAAIINPRQPDAE